MSDQNPEILKTAIERAIEAGWSYLGTPDNGWGFDAGQWHVVHNYLCIYHFKMADTHIHYSQILFNHDFARAIWGEDNYPVSVRGSVNLTNRVMYTPAWMIHIQQMVIAEDPIRYLGDNIETI